MVLPLLAIAAFGAIAGGGIGALSDKKKPLRGALIGAGAGALGGAGLAAAGAFGGAAAVGGASAAAAPAAGLSPTFPGAFDAATLASQGPVAGPGGFANALAGLDSTALPGLAGGGGGASGLLRAGASLGGSASGPAARGALAGGPLGDALISQGISSGVGALQGPETRPQPIGSNPLAQIRPGQNVPVPGPADIGAQVQPANFGGQGVGSFPAGAFGGAPGVGAPTQDPRQRQLELLLALSGAGQPALAQ